MTEVLTHPQTDSPFASRPLSRSGSQSSLYLPKAEYDASRPAAFAEPRKGSTRKPTTSLVSSPPSSPRLALNDSSSQPSLLSTPSSSLSLDEECCDENEILFPSYDVGKHPAVTSTVVRSRGQKGSPIEVRRILTKAATWDYPMPEVPLSHNPSFVSMGDDAAVKKEPARHVDYLSHTWTEEDVCCSWRHVVGRRRELENSARLENASWRSWTKAQNRLNTLSPEKLNWMKDHDVTWLYGPLQTLDPMAFNPDSPVARSRLSRTNSFISKKPILKRRSVSEAMLQRSLSNSTLVRQAVDCLTSQENTYPPTRPMLPVRPSSQFKHQTSPTLPSPHPSLEDGSFDTPSGAETPNTERKHIHFNDKVEQCIAVDKDVEDLDYFDSINSSDESSDDGVLMMQTSHGKERKLSNAGAGPRPTAAMDGQNKLTIAMLPATTLKYRSDTPEPPEVPDRQATPRVSDPKWSRGRGLQHSSSAETLKPPKPSSNFLLDDEDYDDEALDWQPSPLRHRSADGYNRYSEGGIPLGLGLSEDEDEELEARGMRRTASGMFMPYDGDESDDRDSGLMGRVVDTVNTARDIAHVIWNVGWRR